MNDLLQWLDWAPAWLHPWMLSFFIFILGWALMYLIWRVLHWRKQRTEYYGYEAFLRYLGRPLQWLVPLLLILVFLPRIDMAAEGQINLVGHLVETVVYVVGAWTLIGLTDVVAAAIRRQYDVGEADNLRERKVITQLQYLRKVAIIIVTILALAFILLQFDRVREVGAGLLTSAGVAGIIIGVAAQKSIANLLAGFQIAFTQPIRIDDIVVLEGEFGWIEEITLTYVVVRIWDQRRLVVPLQYFIEKPFQSWTRKTSEILGTVYIYADYDLPVQAIRDELDRYLPDQPLWDGRVVNVVVFEAHPTNMQIRVLVSGRNAPQTFDLRCAVREHLITFIQENYPDALPRTRVEVEGGGEVVNS